MKHFMNLTMGHAVIMGRKTYESMMKPLRDRTNIIITRNQGYKAEGCLVVNSLDKALELVKDDERPYIIGGAEIYKLALPKTQRMELTFVHHEFEGDAHFPEFDKNEWKVIFEERHEVDERHAYPFTFYTYERV